MADPRQYAGRPTWLVAIHLCGAAAGVLIFGAVLTGVIVEARQLWGEGAAVFFSDAGMRLFVGACVAALSAVPYLLIARASLKGGSPILFLSAAMAMLALQLWFMLYTLFFARSATASIGLLFMPLYLCVPAGAIWMAAVLAREIRLRRSPKGEP